MSGPLDGLTTRLRDPDRNVRVRAALDIGKLNDGRAAGALIEALAAEPDFFVRETLTWSVVRLGRAATPLLIERLQDENALVRHDAAHALGKIGDPRALKALIAILGDENPAVVAKAAFALGRIRDARAIPSLVGILGTADRELEATLNNVLGGFSSAAVQPLVQALAHADWRTREQAAEALREIGNRTAAPVLALLSSDPCWRVRFAAINALSRLGAEPGIFEAFRHDTDRRVRALASRVLNDQADHRQWVAGGHCAE